MPFIKRTISSVNNNIFPLSINVSGRYLVTTTGTPFFLVGDSPWSLEVQCTTVQIDTYLNTRASQGFTAILFECMEHFFSSQSPPYQNAQSGANPFTTMTDFSTPNETYWTTIDYIVNGAKSRGIACFIFPAYLGFTGGSQGWTSEINADTAGHLQTYGAFLANRYTQGNVVWVMGGDYAGDATLRAKQWNIVTGMRTVRTTDLICAHPARSQDAYALWGPGGDNLTGWNLGTTYCQQDGSDAYSLAATAYGRSGPVPFGLIENGYENEATLTQMRYSLYSSRLGGSCFEFFGNNPIWGFGEPNANGGAGAASAIANNLNTTGATQVGYFVSLMQAYSWWKLVPKTDASLVTTALGTGLSHISPALASDGSFAMIFTPSVNFTVDMSQITHGSVRARWYDPTAGTFSTDAASPLANSGTHAFTAPGERVLVLD